MRKFSELNDTQRRSVFWLWLHYRHLRDGDLCRELATFDLKDCAAYHVYRLRLRPDGHWSFRTRVVGSFSPFSDAPPVQHRIVLGSVFRKEWPRSSAVGNHVVNPVGVKPRVLATYVFGTTAQTIARMEGLEITTIFPREERG